MTTKKKKVVTGIVTTVCLVAVMVVTLLSNFSSGQRVVLAETFVREMSDSITEQTMDSLQTQLSEEMITRLLEQVLPQEKLNEMVLTAFQKQLNEDEAGELSELIRAYVEEQIKQYTSVLTKEQREQIQNMIQQTITVKLNNLEVNNISDELMASIEAGVREALTGELKQYVDNSVANIDVTKLAEHMDLTGTVEKIVKDQKYVKESDLTTIKESIIRQVESATSTPVKGVDYLTDSEVTSITENAANVAVTKINSTLTVIQRDVNVLKNDVDNINTYVRELNQKITELKSGGGSGSFSLSDAQKSITDINAAITNINETTKGIGGAIDIHNSWLHRVTFRGGTIDTEEVVSAADMTIAEFVGVLSGNQKEYTTAIKDLYSIVADLTASFGEKNEHLTREIERVDQSITTLDERVDATADQLYQDIKVNVSNINQTITDTKNELGSDIDAISGRLEESLRDMASAVSDHQSEIADEFNRYKDAYDAYLADASAENQQALADAKNALQEALNNYKSDMDDLSSVVDALDVDTQQKMQQMTGAINGVLSALDSSNDDLTNAISSLESASSEAQTALGGRIDEVSSRLEESIRDVNDTMQNNKDELNSSIAGVTDRLNAADTWATGVTLATTEGTNSGTVVYREAVTSGPYAGGYVWKLVGTELGLNIKASSDISISWNSATPEIAPGYELMDNELDIYIEADEASLITADLVLDVVHVETR